MTDQKLIGKRLAIARKRLHIKQVDLAATLGVSDQTISNWEVGLRSPRADLLRRICLELRCSADYLLGLSDEPTPREGLRRAFDDHVVTRPSEQTGIELD